MAALSSTTVLAGRKVAVRTVAPRASRAGVRTCAMLGENKASKAAAAGLAAAVLLNVNAADAGVVLAKKELKNALVDDTPALSVEEKKAAKAEAKKAEKAAPAEAKAAPEVKAEKKEEKKSEGGLTEGGSVLPLIFPTAIVGLLGAGFALTKIDPEFAEVLDKGASRDCNEYAGTETTLKGEAFAMAGAKGTKVLSKPAKKGGFFG